jgi:uncharacterized damage-inducible protein DinB
MEASILPLRLMVDLNTRLFANCLDGVDDDLARQRPDDAVNNFAFTALHLADARYFLAGLLGVEVENPFEEYEEVSGIEDMQVFPSLEAILAAWQGLAPILTSRLEALTSQELGQKAPTEFPIGDPTLLGALAFLVQHEGYHIGQLGLMRKRLGLGAMSYA